MKKRTHNISKKKHKPSLKNIILAAALMLAAVLIYQFINVYSRIYESNVLLDKNEKASVFIPSDADYEVVKQIFTDSEILIDTVSFDWVAKKKNYPSNINGGHYVIKGGLNNNELINLLRGGFQTPVNVTFHNIRTKAELAGTIANQLEADSLELMTFMNDDAFLDGLGFENHTIIAMFIPNTYEFYWNPSAEKFFFRMKDEYEKFWNGKREQQLDNLNLTKVQVSTLASIVDEETYINDELDEIAGVYINRLEKGIRLQADPTVRFALNNFGIKRVLRTHLEIDSPYNTYKIAGLPPGPIAIPSIAAIDGVLNYAKHDYIYFCAKADFSGRHEFSKTLNQHLRYAREYQRALNRQRIYR
ncbi:MAG: endolytic transglycosylase MltG [Bacteroidota bacterium]